MIKVPGPTQLLEEQADTFARDGQRVVQRRLDELTVSCSQAEELLCIHQKEKTHSSSKRLENSCGNVYGRPAQYEGIKM